MAVDFLVEIGTEELPPKALDNLSESFEAGIKAYLSAANFKHGTTSRYATPRRLAVLVRNLDEKQQDQTVEKLGPAVQAAFDGTGNPTKAAEGFARSNGVSFEQLEQVETDKGLRLAFRSIQAGKTAAEELPQIVTAVLDGLPIPKRMKWGAKRDEFVRPVHWLVMLLGEQLIDCKILGIQSGINTYGHRFHHPQAIRLSTPSAYETLLEEHGQVIASFEKRRCLIEQQVETLGEQSGGTTQIDPALLDEVTALVEWPVALSGHFDEAFLQVPAEALISSMKSHQKYFHVQDQSGKLLPHFITVANIISNDAQKIIEGNEKVIRPRLADAAFFFATDKKTTLESKSEKLKNVIFQHKLGSVYDKTERIAKLSTAIAARIGGDVALAQRAAQLCKADLVSEMVHEFEDLQGVMGAHYARHDGEAEEVALALNEQYLPRFSGDDLPSSLTGAALALADRLDTLVGIFGIGELPTGNKDPFALRRASLGVLNIIVRKQLDLDLRPLLELAVSNYTELPCSDGLIDKVLAYVNERFRAWYGEEGISTEVFLAVQAKNISKPLDFEQRIKAVDAFSKLEQAASLAAANKRVSNILAKQTEDGDMRIDASLLEDTSEKTLATQLIEHHGNIAPLLQSRQYEQALTILASLKTPIDDFFDNVMVMVDDPALRRNRLAILQQLRSLFLEVADISLLASNK